MTNYYLEFDLDKNDSISDINKKLTQYERTWMKREVNNPEKARIMLALIYQAKQVFESENSRREYDRELSNNQNKAPINNPNDDRKQQFQKWFDNIKQYYDNNQYDLAKTAVEKALSVYDPSSDNDEFLCMTARVYEMNNEYLMATNYINQAIDVLEQII